MTKTTVEDDILGTLEDQDDTLANTSDEDELDDSGSEDASEDEGDENEDDNSQEEDAEEEGEGGQAKQGDSKAGKKKSDGNEGERAQDIGDPNTVLARLGTDAKGNLVDANGNIVAKAGAERRLYEGLRKAQFTNQQLNSQVQQLSNAVTTLKVINGLPEKLGLSLSDVDGALHMMAEFKKDPAKALTDLIAGARANGIDLKLDGASSGIDLAAISAMIDKRLAPITNKFTAEQAATEATQDAQQQAERFFGQFPDAIPHESVLAGMIRQTGDSPEVAYWKLKAWAAEQGLNFGAPLKPQMEARQQQQQGKQQSTSGDRTRQKPRVTQGRRGDTSVGESDLTDNDDPVSVETSYTDIIRESMKKHGLK